ncbi:MAG: hypothetical protein Q9160_000950 [Pyrenula sp. 1 TL-2023]
MVKIIVVIGATGAQGGSVARRMAKSSKWKVRAVTRNPEGDSAKSLVSVGCDVVAANMDDIDSLVKAFEGANAIFAVTNFWEHLLAKGPEGAGEHEVRQAKNLAQAASRTSTLEHYVWSTLPSSVKLTKGKVKVPHFDHKETVDEHIKTELPELAKKTTFVFMGFYPSNMAYFPFLKFLELVSIESSPFPKTVLTSGSDWQPMSFGGYLLMAPGSGDIVVPIAGDVENNTGLFVQAIVEHPEASLPAKYVDIRTDDLQFEEMTKIWSDVTGKRGTYVAAPADKFKAIWGAYGEEWGAQVAFMAEGIDWASGIKESLVEWKNLGVTRADYLDFQQSLEKLKPLLT